MVARYKIDGDKLTKVLDDEPELRVRTHAAPFEVPVRDERTYDDGFGDGVESAVDSILSSVYPERIITNGPATIIFWRNGSKTVVKRRKGDKNDTDAAVAQAIAKKLYFSNSRFHSVVRNAARKEKK